MSMGCMTVEYFAGSDFSDVIKDMRRLRTLLNCSIQSSLNGVIVTVMGDDMSVDEAVSKIRNKICTDDKFFIVN